MPPALLYVLCVDYKRFFSITDNHIVFESEEHPGRHIGVLPGGALKSPSSTGEGEHGQFMPRVKGLSPYSRPQ